MKRRMTTKEEHYQAMKAAEEKTQCVNVNDGCKPCCYCGYDGEKETPCSLSKDGQHCEHWWG